MKKNGRNQWLSMTMIVALLAVTVLGGCGGGNSDSGTTAATTAAETQAETTAAAETQAETTTAGTQAAESDLAAQVRGNTDPSPELVEQVNTTLDDSYLWDPYGMGSDYSVYDGRFDGVTLDIWMPSLFGTAEVYTDLNQHPVFQQISQLTGIKLNFISPTVGEEQTEFNLMVSGGDLPDIIINGMNYYSGGAVAAETDGLILDLTPYEDKLPNYMYFVNNSNNSDSLKKDSVTDDGRRLVLYELITRTGGLAYGPNIKRKAMEDTGWTEAPETIDEWHSFLVDCKNAGYDIPFLFTSTNGFAGDYGMFSSAYGVYNTLFVNDEGKVAYGPVQDGLEDYLKTMNQWYTEGLFDPDFMTADSAHFNSLLVSEDTAACQNSSASVRQQLQCDWSDIVAPTYPVLNKGDQSAIRYHFTYVGNTAAVTTQCENVDAALAFLDFGFSKKGWEIYGLGSYGDVHLVNEEGRPYYPEDSLVNTDEDCVQKRGNYRLSKFRLHHFPGVYGDWDSNPDTAEEATAIVQARTNPAKQVALPPVSLTPEEAETITEIQTNIETLRDEYLLKIITGQLPLSAAQEFRDQAAQMGLDTYVSVYQAAYDRYQAR